jgi:hypothetical protein
VRLAELVAALSLGTDLGFEKMTEDHAATAPMLAE